VAKEFSIDKPKDSTSTGKNEVEGGLAMPSAGGLDVETFTRYYLASRASLRSYLGTKLQSEAACEDCMQEVVLLMWNRCEGTWELEDFRRVAFTTAKFKALSWLKKHKPAIHLNLSTELSERLEHKAAELWDVPMDFQFDRIEALRVCVESLPSKQRELIKVRYETGNPNALVQFAASQGKKMEAIYKQLERTRSALRDCVERKMKR
jgi:RNA polymerase sigma factor (sigma-70 family)